MRKTILFTFALAAVAACGSPPPVPEVDAPTASAQDLVDQGAWCCPFFEEATGTEFRCCRGGASAYEVAGECMADLYDDGHLVTGPTDPGQECDFGPPEVDLGTKPIPIDVEIYDPPGEEPPLIVGGLPYVPVNPQEWVAGLWYCTADVYQGKDCPICFTSGEDWVEASDKCGDWWRDKDNGYQNPKCDFIWSSVECSRFF